MALEGGSARRVAFIAMMAALGNAMFALSITVLNWGNIALDLSHIGTAMAAIYAGPLAGAIVGALVGIGGGLYFGSVSGLMALYLPGFIVGKSMTGATIGGLVKAARLWERRRRSLVTALIVALGYVPECLFTVAFFLVLIPMFAPPAIAGFLTSLLVPILIKAWAEVIMIGFYMAALVGNQGFLHVMARL
ncbi:hypothetical protein B6U99_06550 [Candidatus Geothermarchaeota archaeon ex4572_27]|nr:MAG: hypothetical protein B6U99_06550 [Candidatus Geothermarchaeota archaeon ex4572_27]